MSERCGISICGLLIMSVTLAISIVMYVTGCINGMCPRFIHTNGVITRFHYTTKLHRVSNTNEYIPMYNIYVDIVTTDNLNCSSEVYSDKRRLPNMNSTTIYDYSIGQTHNVYIIKENSDKCIIDDDGKLYLNAITAIIMFILFGISTLLLLSWFIPVRTDELSYSMKMFVKNVYSKRPSSPKILPT